jgi:hypothetical protein
MNLNNLSNTSALLKKVDMFAGENSVTKLMRSSPKRDLRKPLISFSMMLEPRLSMDAKNLHQLKEI